MKQALLPLPLLLLAAAPAAAQDDLAKLYDKLQPARGVYTLRQRGNADSNGTVAMSGRMVLEARLTCDELATTMTMDIRATSGAQTATLKLEQRASETRDGRIYRFSAVTYERGRELERREGQAVLQSRDGPGEAKIKGVAGEDLRLESGTVLPGTHMLRVMQAALAGKKEIEHRVFHGLEQMRITNSRAVIVGAGRSGKGPGLGEFADKPGWTVREEIKPVGGLPGGTSQTSEAFVTEDGVTTTISISVQGLELQGTPLSIEKLPRPDCKK